MIKFLVFAVVSLFATLAFAQYGAEGYSAGAVLPIESWTDQAMKFVPLLVAVMAACRALAEILLWFANLTRNKGVGRAAEMVARAAEAIARVLALFGIGTPKPITMARAEKIATKELATSLKEGAGDKGATT